MISQNEALSIYKVCKDISATWSRIRKLDAISAQPSETVGYKRRQKARIDADYLYRHLASLEHEMHCLAVECGIAEPDESRYGTFIEKPDAWHEYKVERRRPRADINTLQEIPKA